MIIDSSALIEIVKGQPSAERCSVTLLGAASVRISAANLLEVYLVADGLDDPDAGAKVDRLLRLGQVVIEPVTEAHVRVARDAALHYGRNRHPAKLNYGDCFAYALARERGEPLLFVGDDFGQTDIEIA